MVSAEANANRLQEARTHLRRYWKHENFRAEQSTVIGALLDGKDVLAVMATGGGKSVCFQIPPLVLGGMALVVSPLVALMQDQVNALKALGIGANYLSSTLTKRHLDKRLDEAADGLYRVLYVSPERLKSRSFRGRAPRMNVVLIAVDEAHCVSVWGHDFRPSYRDIPDCYELLGRPPVLGTTGTATPRVQADIASGLLLRDPLEVIGRFDRPNIYLRAALDVDKGRELRRVLGDNPGSGIVYAGSRRAALRWQQVLQKEGHAAVTYHAGLGARERTTAFRKWMRRKARVVVATNAFGMGVDKPDVRFVVHMEAPYSLEAYYQEAGRAGRDGAHAEAVLISSSRDVPMQDRVVEGRYPEPGGVTGVYDAICSAAQIAVGERPDAPVAVDLTATAKATKLSPGAVEHIINLMAASGVWSTMPGHWANGMIRMHLSAHNIRRFSQDLTNEERYRFIIALLRVIEADAFRDWQPVDLSALASQLSLSQTQLLSELAFLQEREVLSWRTIEGDIRLKFRRERAEQLTIDHAAIWHNRRRAVEQLEHMRRYLRESQCRGQLLLRYFGEEDAPPCGHCDLCARGGRTT